MLPLHQVALRATKGQLFLPLVFLSVYSRSRKISKRRRDLDFPAHKVMVMIVRCEEIANENLAKLASNKNWLELKEAAQSCLVLGFGTNSTKVFS
jgi:hypothetical protein